MNDKERKTKIEELKDRLANIPARKQLENLYWHLTHCPKCESGVLWGAEVCETCGEELMEHGKN